jgi:hypothetical protein
MRSTDPVYVPIAHSRGLGYMKIIPCGDSTPARILTDPESAGAIAWLKRADKRQITLDLRVGKIYCEQQ